MPAADLAGRRPTGYNRRCRRRNFLKYGTRFKRPHPAHNATAIPQVGNSEAGIQPDALRSQNLRNGNCRVFRLQRPAIIQTINSIPEYGSRTCPAMVAHTIKQQRPAGWGKLVHERRARFTKHGRPCRVSRIFFYTKNCTL